MRHTSLPSIPGGQDDSMNIDLVSVARIVRRRWMIVLTTVGLVLTGAIAYSLLAAPVFTGVTTVVMDARRVHIFGQDKQDSSVVGEMPVDNSTVDSQLTILRSEVVLQEVIKKLDLMNDPEFAAPSPSLIGWVVGGVKSLFISNDGPPATEEQRIRGVMEAMRSQLRVQRAGLSHAIELSFTAGTPQKAAEIANAIAEAYLQDKIESTISTSQRASTWLQERLDELRQQAIDAEIGVLEFRSRNNLVDVDGKLIYDRQINEVSSQLSQARSQTMEARAKLDRIEAVLSSDERTGAVGDMLRNEVIGRLRTQYADATRREAEFSTRYAAGHPVLVNLQNELKEIQRSIEAELQRIAETFRSDYAIARSRESFLQNSLRELSQQALASRQVQVKLRDLESAAQSYRALYDNLLQRYNLAVQQQSFPIAGARIITRATPPTVKSWPSTTTVLAAGLVAGLGLGVAGAFLREYLDKTIYTADQLSEATGTRTLGSLPVIGSKLLASHERRAPDLQRRLLSRENVLLTYAADAPFSHFAETIRSVKVSLDTYRTGSDGGIIGVTSTFGDEGKTTVSSNLGHLMAQTGARVLMIDADLRRTAATRDLAPPAKAGLIEVLMQKTRLSDAVWHDPETGLQFLPAVLEKRIHHTNEIISSQAMKEFLDEARKHYKYIILDLPPLAPVVDVQAAVHLIDGIVFVAEAERTTEDEIRRVLGSSDLIDERIVGSILNKVDPVALERANRFGAYVARQPRPSLVA
jgi:succinoglycan biosynthesis transport protein ExoP